MSNTFILLRSNDYNTKKHTELSKAEFDKVIATSKFTSVDYFGPEDIRGRGVLSVSNVNKTKLMINMYDRDLPESILLNLITGEYITVTEDIPPSKV